GGTAGRGAYGRGAVPHGGALSQVSGEGALGRARVRPAHGGWRARIPGGAGQRHRGCVPQRRAGPRGRHRDGAKRTRVPGNVGGGSRRKRVTTSGLGVVMTRKKQSWGQQRGWIVPADGSPPQELPQQMVGHKLISWPGTMPEKQSAEPAKYLASKDYYHRHVLNPEGVSVYDARYFAGSADCFSGIEVPCVE